MNDLVRQLVGMAPGLGQAAAGNGTEFAAFMEGWERARQEDEQRKRLQQQDSLAMEDRSLRLEDRQRGIERQTAADQVATQQRGQQDAMQSLQIPGHLAELGATADDPQGAQALIESAMPKLMAAFGQDTMGMGQPAVEMATRAITGRQKKQVEAFIDAALKTSFVADNPDADPEINLPEHIAKVVGKPKAKLSELQQFAQLPVGKPAGKTRIPPAAGSMEEYADPSTTPERRAEIEKLRKGYMQSDDRPPVGNDPEIAELRKELLRLQVERAGQPVQPKEPNQQQFTSAGFAGRMEQAEPILTSVAPTIVAMSVPKFELQTNSWFAKPTFQSQDVQSYMQAARNFINAVLRRESGAVISPEEFREARSQYLPIAGDTDQTLAQKAANRRTVIDTMRRSAGSAYEPPVQPGGMNNGPKPGERKRSPSGDLIEWDGKGWFVVRP